MSTDPRLNWMNALLRKQDAEALSREDLRAFAAHFRVARLAQRAVTERSQILTVDDHAAAGRTVQQIDGAYQRTFAGAASADDAENLASGDG